jgi:hypothetical protein
MITDCHINQEENKETRLALIQRLTPLAVADVLSTAQEVFGLVDVPRRLGVVAFHAYCTSLVKDNIYIEPGQYEPHPMYMRAFLRGLFVNLKMVMQGIKNLKATEGEP